MATNTAHRGNGGPSIPSPELSIVFSCYNQAEVLESAIRECFHSIARHVASFEILIINDGSTDGSVRILDRLRKEFPHLRVTHQLRSGRSRAVRRGFDLARGEFVFQMELGKYPLIADFSKLWEVRDRYAVVSGYQPRKHRRIRRLLYWALSRWIKLWYGAELAGPDSHFHLCRREIALGYLNQIPPDYEGVELALTLLMFREVPALLLEIPVGVELSAPPTRFSDLIARFMHYFWEIPGTRLKRPVPVAGSPATHPA